MSYNVANFEETVHSDGSQGTIQISDGNLGFEGANNVTINSLGDITANAFFGFSTGGGGETTIPTLQAVTLQGATTDRAVTISNSLSISGNLFVTGNLVSVDVENLVVQDPIIQLANSSTSDTADTGIVFTRPTSNVVVGWRGGEDEVMIGFSTSSANSTDLVPLDDNKLNLKVYGNVEATNYVKGDATHLTNLTDASTGTYGSTTQSVIVQVDGNGRITSVSETNIDYSSAIQGIDSVLNTENTTSRILTIGGVTVTGTESLLGDANGLSNIVNSDITPGTYGSGTQVPQVVIDSDHRIKSITNIDVSTETLQSITDTGNTTSNTVQFTNIDVSLTASGNVEIQGYYIGNANLLSNIVNSDIGPATYGNATHVTQITVTNSGRISEVSNVEIEERSNLEQIVNRGNITSNTVHFSNSHTALVTDLISNVDIKFDQLSSVDIHALSGEHILLYDGVNWVNDYSVRNFTKINNKTGTTLYKGNTVYIVDGHNVNVANVALADATDSSKMPAIGLVFADVANQAEGVAVTYGKVQNINVDGFLEGETVYVSNTQIGGISNIKPTTNGEFIQNVGIVVKTGSSGTVFVTGVGRTNDIPNGTVTTEQDDMLYMYGETSTSRFAKITPQDFRSNLDQIVNTGNVTANTLVLNGVPNALEIGEGSNIYFNNAITLHSNTTISSISIGCRSGSGNNETICIGRESGQTNQGRGSVAIGSMAGRDNQGEYSVALGYAAGISGQAKKTIVLNATGYMMSGQNSEATYIKPIRVENSEPSKLLGYISSTGEIVNRDELHSNLEQIVSTGNVTSNTVQFINPTVSLVATGNIEAQYYLGNANLLSNIVNSDVGPATYGNTTHIAQITISDTGRITTVSNIEIQERSNLDQVVNRGNVTSNSISVGGIVATGQANVANIVVSQAVGAGPTVSSNIITVDQAGHSYKFFRVLGYPTASLEGITIQNTTDGCQTLVDIHPIGGDLDVFENFSNGGAGPTVLTSLQSNLVINTGNHVMISCVTDLSNTFVNIIGFY